MEKRIKNLSLIASILFLIYIVLILISCMYPDYAKIIPYFDYLEEYDLKDYRDDCFNIIVPAFFNIMLFSISFLRIGSKRVISKKNSIFSFIISVIFIIAEYISFFVIRENVSLYNEFYIVNLRIIDLAFIIPMIGEFILAFSCAYEVMYCNFMTEKENSSFGFTFSFKMFLFILFSIILSLIIMVLIV